MPDAASLYGPGLVTYGREGLSTHRALTDALAALEGATRVALFPSGLAAMTGALTAVLKAGDEILVTDAIYKPTRRFCDRVLGRFGVGVRYHPPEASAETLAALIGPATRLILMESPGSLTLEMQDVPAIAAMARARGVLTMIDNTWAAGVHFKPLAHGVDISAQSLTKYVGGHSDVFMGSVAVADPRLAAKLDEAVLDFGWAVSAEDAYLMLRGLRTLPARLDRHEASGLQVARWLARHPRVAGVLHPALDSFPGHALWKRNYTGAAGLFAFVLAAAQPGEVEAFLNALRVFALGFSWGGFESLALNADPQFSGRRYPPNFAGPLIRLSIGLEDPQALIADLDQALAA
jgi:cystathionine beta-lyase